MTHAHHKNVRTDRQLRPIGQAILGSDIEPLVRDICRRIQGIRHRTQAGAYVLADRDGHVYLLQETASTTANMVRRQLAIVVGLYANEPIGKAIVPDAESMRMDLLGHFFRVGFLQPEMVYGQVAHEP